MSRLLQQWFQTNGAGRWLSSVLFILVVVLAGLVLPQLMPSAPAGADSSAARAAAPAEAWSYDAPPLADGPDAKAMLLQLGLGTAFVLVLGVGTLWLGKRCFQVKPSPPGGTRHLRLVEALPLQGRSCVYLVQVGSRQILVGADAAGLKALVPLGDSFEQTLSQAQVAEPQLLQPS